MKKPGKDSASPSAVNVRNTYLVKEVSGIVVVNKNTIVKTVRVNIKNFRPGTNYYWYTLTGGTDNGDFSGSVYINDALPTGATGGPLNYADIKANDAFCSGKISCFFNGRK
jgi:hypothetical protein